MTSVCHSSEATPVCSWRLAALFCVYFISFSKVNAFQSYSPKRILYCDVQHAQQKLDHRTLYTSLYSTSVDINNESETVVEDQQKKRREELKKSLFKLAASYDRGFGASPSARSDASKVIEELETLNTCMDAGRGADGSIGSDGQPPPLQGNWRMIWTSAQDVLSLAASPVVTVGAIYQIIEPPVVTNIIDLIPRPQALLPPGVMPSSLVRAKVTTRSSVRASPMRVGLVFEKVQLQPIEILGMAADNLPPLGFDLPRFDVSKLPGVQADGDETPGYFDVSYLDEELLIIRQNAPGGLFVLVKSDSYNP